MILIVPRPASIHRHYTSVAAQLAAGVVGRATSGANHVVLLVRELDAATAEALGYIRSFRPSRPALRVRRRGRRPPPSDGRRVRGRCPGPRAACRQGATCCTRCATTSERSLDRSDDFVTVVVPEVVTRGALRLRGAQARAGPAEGRAAARAQRGGHRRARAGRRTSTDGGDAAADPPAHRHAGVRVGGERRHDPRRELRAIAGCGGDARDLLRSGSGGRPTGSSSSGSTRRLPIPLDIVEAPFRDLTAADAGRGPPLLGARGHGRQRDHPRVHRATSGGICCCTTRTRCSSSGCSCSSRARS